MPLQRLGFFAGLSVVFTSVLAGGTPVSFIPTEQADWFIVQGFTSNAFIGPSRAVFADGHAVSFRGSQKSAPKRVGSRLLQVAVWNNVSVEWHGSDGELEYDFVVEPGGSPQSIRLAIEGGQTSLTPEGDLLVRSNRGSRLHTRPVAWQIDESGKHPVEAWYTHAGSDEYGIATAQFNPALPLIIDPVVRVFPDFRKHVLQTAVDLAGNYYVASSDTYDGECYVSKYSPSGQLVWETKIPLPAVREVRRLTVAGRTGDVYILGMASGTIWPDRSDLTRFIANVTPTGARVTLHRVPWMYDDIGADPDGNLAVTWTTGEGAYNRPAPTSGVFSNRSDCSVCSVLIVQKYAPDIQSVLWTSTINSVPGERNVTFDLNGTIFLTPSAQWLQIPAQLQPALLKDTDRYLLKLSSAGKLEWAIRFGATAERLSILASDNGTAVTGCFGQVEPVTGLSGLFFVTIAADGKSLTGRVTLPAACANVDVRPADLHRAVLISVRNPSDAPSPPLTADAWNRLVTGSASQLSVFDLKAKVLYSTLWPTGSPTDSLIGRSSRFYQSNYSLELDGEAGILQEWRQPIVQDGERAELDRTIPVNVTIPGMRYFAYPAPGPLAEILDITKTTETTPGALRLRLTREPPQGFYHQTIELIVAGVIDGVRRVPLKLIASPRLTLTPNQAEVTKKPGVAASVSTVITPSFGFHEYVYRPSVPWLSYTGATVWAGRTMATFTIAPDLPEGVHSGSVSISVGGSERTAATLTVRVAVGAVSLYANPAKVMHVQPGGMTRFAVQANLVWAADTAPFGNPIEGPANPHYTLPIQLMPSTANWLKATLTSNTTPANLLLEYDMTGLKKGQHSTTLTLVSPGVANSPFTLPVTLDVKRVCTVTVHPRTTVLPQSGGAGRIHFVGNGPECDPADVSPSEHPEFWTLRGSKTATGFTATADYNIPVTADNRRYAIFSNGGYAEIVKEPVSVVPETGDRCGTALPQLLDVPAESQTMPVGFLWGGPTCPVTVRSSASWLSVQTGQGSVSTVSAEVFSNSQSTTREALLTINGTKVRIIQAPSRATATERFLRFVYSSALGREASVDEVAAASRELATGSTRAQIAEKILASEEFNVSSRFIAGLYVGLLGRDAEYSGWLHQRLALGRRLATQEQLVRNFIESPEFSLKFGNLSNEGFVKLLYRQVLLREATDPEVRFHAGSFAAGITRTTLARNMLNTAEFRIGVGPRLTAFLLYAILMQRDAATAELNFQAAALEKGASVGPALDAFLRTPEFEALVR